MLPLSYSSAESRLLMATLQDFGQTKKTSTRGTQVSATPTQQTFTNRTPVGSANFALPLTQQSTFGTVSQAPQIVPKGYSYLNDPTYIGNLGPSDGQSWSGGTQRFDGSMAGGSNANPYMTIDQQAQAYADSLVKPPEDPAISRDFNAEAMAKEQAKQAFYAKLQADTAQKRAEADKKYRQMLSSNQPPEKTTDTTNINAPTEKTQQNTIIGTTGAINAKTQPELTMKDRALLRGDVRGINMSKQDFIEQKRSEGMSDVQIRQELAKLPPDAFGKSQTTSVTQATGQDGTTTAPAPSVNAPESTQTDKTTQDSQVAPPTPVYPPQASTVREQMMLLAKDNPQIGLIAALYDEDVMREEQAKQNALLSLGSSIAGAEQEYTDTQTYIDKWVSIANQNSDKLTGILQSNNEETNKVLEQQRNNALAKLEYDRQVETQQLEKKKATDVLKSSIAIGLRGGAYSGAAQNALAESERDWDVAIQNLGKEYSFKAADVMTDYTAKYVTAKQNLALNLFDASEKLSNKIEGYANAGFASLQAKKKAITEAKNDYRKTIDTLAKEHATETRNYIKEINDIVNKQNEAKKKDSKSTGDKLSFTSGLRKEIEGKKTVIQAKEVQGFVNVANVAYDRYTKLLAEIKSGKSSSEALSPAQTAVVTSLAKILDPGSVVRNEEYERQARGQGFIDRVTNLYDQFKSGSQFSPRQVEEMWSLANQIQDSWQERLSSEIQPVIMDISDWNESYPEAKIRYEQVVPNIDSLPLVSETFNKWAQQADDTSNAGGFSPSSSPNGWRTDRHNNPLAFAVKIGGTNDFTDALDNAGIQWSYGDPFPKNKDMVTVRINNKDDAVEASRAVLANSNALQNWYLSPNRPYASSLKQFGIQDNQDFANLPRSTQDQVIATIYKGEVGDGSLIGQSSSPKTQRKSYSLVPTAQAESPDDTIYIEGDDEDTGEIYQNPLKSETAISPGMVPGAGLGLKYSGELVTYKNTMDGSEKKVAKGSRQEQFMLQRGYWKNVEDIKKEKKVKPIMFAGKPLPQ